MLPIAASDTCIRRAGWGKGKSLATLLEQEDPTVWGYQRLQQRTLLTFSICCSPDTAAMEALEMPEAQVGDVGHEQVSPAAIQGNRCCGA